MFIVIAFLNEGSDGGRNEPRHPILATAPRYNTWTQSIQLRTEILDQAPSALSRGRLLPCD
jgi:hypothetical protein